MADQLTLGLVITAALLDSINPCVFGVLIFLLAYMTKMFKNKNKMLVAGATYTFTVYVIYFLIGLGLFTFAYTTSLIKPFYLFAAFVAIVAGALEIKDYFWYGRWFSLSMIPGADERIKHYMKLMSEWERKGHFLTMVVPVFLGIFVVFVELPCTGAPYLAILGLLSKGVYSSGIPLLLLYNFIFIVPLFVIIGLVYFGYSSKKLEGWRKEQRGLMRLAVGLFMMALGLYMLWLSF